MWDLWASFFFSEYFGLRLSLSFRECLIFVNSSHQCYVISVTDRVVKQHIKKFSIHFVLSVFVSVRLLINRVPCISDVSFSSVGPNHAITTGCLYFI